MTKKQAIKKIEKILKANAEKAVKEIDKVLNSAGLWYCQDEIIKEYDDMHKKDDRNGDQLAVDFLPDVITGAHSMIELKEEHLWSEDDLTKD